MKNIVGSGLSVIAWLVLLAYAIVKPDIYSLFWLTITLVAACVTAFFTYLIHNPAAFKRYKAYLDACERSRVQPNEIFLNCSEKHLGFKLWLSRLEPAAHVEILNRERAWQRSLKLSLPTININAGFGNVAVSAKAVADAIDALGDAFRAASRTRP